MKPDLEAIGKRLEATTPGPWLWVDNSTMISGDRDVISLIEINPRYGVEIDIENEDADFIAHAPADIADLLKYVGELESIERREDWQAFMLALREYDDRAADFALKWWTVRQQGPPKHLTTDTLAALEE